ncbi:MAG: phenylalanine--tRNA ligase subunit alpha [Planctomycetota bacterium]
MLKVIDELAAAAAADLDAVEDAAGLEVYRIKYLGSKGAVKGLMGRIKEVPKEAKREFGQRANAARAAVEEAFAAKKAEIGGDHGSGGSADAKGAGATLPGGVDVTLPAGEAVRGRRHVITQTIDELVEVFGRMGFDVVTGPEVEDDRHNFVALNIPETHPARDPLDNFYLADPGGDTGAEVPEPRRSQSSGGALMRSQTSTVQVRVMEETEPPVRIISTGRVYRPDEHDATHSSMFHQIEGLYVDRGVSMVDLKTTLIQFARAYWGADAEVKLVPSYFPFTEPSAELYVQIDLGKGPEWMEVGGCGMVDPAVFEAVGYDPETWTGFAFGLGIERLAMRKHGIADIRWLYEGDVRFLRRF